MYTVVDMMDCLTHKNSAVRNMADIALETGTFYCLLTAAHHRHLIRLLYIISF